MGFLAEKGAGFGRMNAGFGRMGAGGFVAVQLPLPENIIAHFSAGSITGIVNGGQVSTWTDSVNGIQATQSTSANKPTFVTNAQGGRPAVAFSGSQWLSIPTPGILKTTVDTQNYTILIAVKVTGTSTFGTAFSCTNDATGLMFIADGTEAGAQINATLYVPYAASSFTTMASVSWSAFPWGNNPNFSMFYLNGGCVCPSNGRATGGNTFFIGSSQNGLVFKGQVYEIVVWNTNLTPPQIKTGVAALNGEYGVPNAWSLVPTLLVCHGDSITAGAGVNTAVSTYPYVAAQALGLAYGQWDNFGIGGQTTNQMIDAIPDWIAPLPAQLNKPIIVPAFEWFNQQQAGDPTASFPYLADLKAIPGIKTVWATSTSQTNTPEPDATRAAYDAYWDANNGVANNIDSYVALHWDNQIGVQGAAAAHPGNFADSVHPNDAGTAFEAADMLDGIVSLYPPVISTFTPPQGASGASISNSLVVTFAENVSLGTSGTISLFNFTTSTLVESWNVATQGGSGPGDVEVVGGNQLTMHLSSNLTTNTQYNIIWDAGVVKDGSGNNVKAKTTTTAWNFTTGTPPTISSLSPANGATGIAVTQALTATFSASIALGTTVAITIFNSDNTVFQAFTSADEGAGLVISGATLTITPSSDFANSSGYYVEISSTSIKNTSGNFFAGINNSTTWAFVTIAPAVAFLAQPVVTSQILFSTGSSDAYGSANSAHSLLIAVVGVKNGGTTPTTPTAFGDSNGNTWTLGPHTAIAGGSGLGVWFYYCLDAAAGANTVSWTLGEQEENTVVRLFEFKATLGSPSGWTLDGHNQFNSTTDTTANPLIDMSITNTALADVALAAAFTSLANLTSGTGWTGFQNTADDNYIDQYQFTVGSGSLNINFTNLADISNRVEVAAAFFPA